MLKLKQRGSKGIYWLTGTLDGSRIRESTGTSSKEHAEVRRIERERELLDRKYLGPEKTATFAQAAVIYLEGGGEGRYVDPLLDWFGVYKIKNITQSEMIRFASATYPGVSAATLNRHVFTPMSAVLRCAAKAGLCDTPSFTRPKQIKQAVEYATDEWLAKLLDACASNASLTAIVLFMTTTGTRVTEACRLHWDDVRESDAILRRTKNGDSRRVMLTPVVLEAMAALPRAAGPVFGYSARWSVNQAIERACDRAGIKYLSSHKIGRHAFAARLLKAGHSLAVVAKAGGWRSLYLVGSTYGHLEQSAIDQAVLKAGDDVGKAGADNVITLQRQPMSPFHVPSGRCGVYVMSAGGYYKVGIADNPSQRLKDLQVGSPLRVVLHHVEIVASKVAAFEVERATHAELAAYRVEGEWFACSLEVVMAAMAAAVSVKAAGTIQAM